MVERRGASGLRDGDAGSREKAAGSLAVALIAAAVLVFRLATAGTYGLFVDELYFLACGEHLAWGYVDMPPLTAVQAWIATTLLGGSQLAIRLLPGVAHAALVLLTGALARRLGGGRWAQLLAVVPAALAPIALGLFSFLSMNAVEPLVWTGMAYALVRVVSGEPRWWLAFGAIAGVGLENKHTVIVFGFAVMVGMLASRQRRLLASRWFLLAGALALLLFLPNLVWNVAHGFPHLEHLAHVRADQRNVDLAPLAFVGQQLLLNNPLAAPVWVGGLVWLLADRRERRFRALGLAYLVALAAMLATNGRIYYLAAAYPMLFAAGGVGLERWLDRARLRAVRPAYAGLLALAGVALAPLWTPVLAPETYGLYARALHMEMPRFEHRRASALPQLFADRFGWPEMVGAVAAAYHALPPEEKAKAVIFGQDYGQAGAIDHFGPALGLPKALSGHLSYWTWGHRGLAAEVVIVMGDDRESLEELFDDVRDAGEVGHVYAMGSQHWTLHVCRRPRGWRTFADIWPRVRQLG